MAKPVDLEKLTGLASRFAAFVAERHPLALADAIDAFEQAAGGRELRDEAAIEAVRPALGRELARRLRARPVPDGLAEPTPRTTIATGCCAVLQSRRRSRETSGSKSSAACVSRAPPTTV